MPALLAAILVFVCSGCVLVLEILAGRLLAPYVGISLETYTSIIGTVLAGIAAGAWVGGRLADRIDPRRLLGPTVALGGLLALFTVPIVRALGDSTSSDGGRLSIIWLTVAGFFLPAVVLSAVHPMVVKLQLDEPRAHRRGRRPVERDLDLRRARRHVRHRVPARGDHAHPHGDLRRRRRAGRDRRRVGPLAVAPRRRGRGRRSRCWPARRPRSVRMRTSRATSRARTTASASSTIRSEPERAHLWLDDLRHSYVDLDDPTRLEFEYIRSFADAVDVAFPDRPRARRAAHRRRRVHHARGTCAADAPGHEEHGARDRPVRAGDGLGASSGCTTWARPSGADRRRPTRHPRRGRRFGRLRRRATRSAASRCRGTSPPPSSSARSTACCGRTACTC